MFAVRLTALAAAAAAALAAPGAGGAARVSVVVVPPFDPAAYASRGAVGLVVPGHGGTVSREGTLGSLRTGKPADAITGGVPSGAPLVHVARASRPPDPPPGGLTVALALPGAGTHENDRRFPVVVLGGGYRGILTSESTRIPGLVTVADVAPAALALERGERPELRWRTDAHAARTLVRLDRRLSTAAEARVAALVLIAGLVGLLVAVAAATRSAYVARVAALAAPCLLLSSAAMAAVDARSAVAVVAGTGLLAVGAAAGGATWARAFPFLLAGTVAAYLVVLAAWPESVSLAALGPHPERAGRFFGTTNLTAMVLTAAGVIAAALLPRRFLLPVALLVLVTVGWSRAGADGGGLLVAAVAFGVLGVLLARGRLTARSLVLVTAGAVAVAVLMVALDAATGGSSHVTGAAGKGPLHVLGEVGHRLRLSWLRLEHSEGGAAVTAAAVAGAAALCVVRPRWAATLALVAATAASLLVNDTPSDAAAAGALSAAVAWGVARSGMQRAGTAK